MSNTKAAALNRAFNNADATVAAQAATVADLAANEIAAANKFDVATLTDAALAKQVMTNMGFLPSTVAAITQLEIELAAYFGGMGKGNRGYVVLQLSDILSTLTADATYGAIATAWNTEVAASVASSTDQSIKLTTGTDTITGGAGNDVISGIVSGVASLLTFNPKDVIDGGAGTADALNLDLGTTWSAMTTGSVSNVETISIVNSSGSATAKTVDLNGFTGVTALKLDSSGAVIQLSGLNTGLKSIDVNSKTGSFTTAYATGAAETASTALTDALTLNLTSVGGLASTTNLVIDVDKIETLNVVNTGTSRVDFFANTTSTDDDLRTINISGSGKITIANVASSVTSIDASATTGGVILTSTSNAGAGALKAISTGSGADTLTAVIQDLTGNAKLSGGVGTDSLSLSSTSTTEAAVEYNMSGIETLTLGSMASTASAYVISAAKTTDLTKVELTGVATGVVGTATAVNLVNMPATGAFEFVSKGATSNNAQITSDHAGATTVTYTAASATSTAATAGDAAAADFTFANAAGALVVAVGGFIDTDTAGVQSTITANEASSLDLTVTSGTTVAGAELTKWDSEITANKATSVVVNATGKLADGAHLNVGKATTATITNGASTGYLDLDAATLKSLTLTTGAAFDFTGSTLTALETLNIAANKGTTTIGGIALNKVNSVTLSGTGTSSAVTLASLGTTAADNNITLTATGLKGGLTATTINANSGYDVSVNVAGVTGLVSLTNINSSTTGKSVDIKASGVGGAFTVGTVYGSSAGTVSIDASNVVGIAKVGDVSGGSVTVDLRGSAVGSYLGGSDSTTAAAIGATSSATINLNELAASKTYTVTATGTTSTALAVTFNGGISADTLVINGRSSTTSITATGNMGAGDDIVTINNSTGAASTINISGLTSYKSSRIDGSASADTITGGAGPDLIVGGRGADAINGGGGADIFLFNGYDSNVNGYDTITGLQSVDQLVSGANTTILNAVAKTVAANGVAVSDTGIASFAGVTAADCDTLAERVNLLDLSGIATGSAAFFTYGSDTFLFIQTAETYTTDVVVKLVGVSMPTAATASAASVVTETSPTYTATGITAFTA